MDETWNDDSEAIVLGGCISFVDGFLDASEHITSAEMFRSPVHVHLWSIIESLAAKGGVDRALVWNEVCARNLAEEIPEWYLLDLERACTIGSQIHDHAEHVARAHRNRALRGMLWDAEHKWLPASDGDPEVVAAKIESTLLDITIGGRRNGPVRIGDAAVDSLKAHCDGGGGIPTGFVEIDRRITSMRPGQMIVIAARPAVGKSALALNIAHNLARNGHSVGIFSLEMSSEELGERLACTVAGVSSQWLRQGRVASGDIEKAWRSAEALRETPIFIDDDAGLTPPQFRLRSKRMRAKHGIACVMLDHIQLVGGQSSRRDLREHVTEVSRTCKLVAKELNIPVVVLSQLNRLAEGRKDKRPSLGDLRESGAIEQDADVVILLHRDDQAFSGDPNWEPNNQAEAIVAKCRNGTTGIAHLTWCGELTRFADAAYSWNGGIPT